jgi:hypothetical protein
MTDQLTWIAFTHAALFVASACYAAFLNQKKVHEWYSPNHVWLTVVGGDTLIGLALGALYLIGAVPLAALIFYASLHIAAGLPVISWQRRRAAKRAGELEAIEKRS